MTDKKTPGRKMTAKQREENETRERRRKQAEALRAQGFDVGARVFLRGLPHSPLMMIDVIAPERDSSGLGEDVWYARCVWCAERDSVQMAPFNVKNLIVKA